MTYSEFWEVMARVFTKVRADSLASDLILPQLGNLSAQTALENGYRPDEVWRAIVEEMELPEKYLYLHRINAHKKQG